MARLAVVRIRGSVNVKNTIEDTMKLMNLTRVNHLTFLEDNPTYMGMLRKAHGYITWGPVDTDDVANTLTNRGEVVGGVRLTDDYVKKNSGFKSIADFTKAFVENKAEIKDVEGLKPVFRMHPPRKGHRGIKRSFKEGGALGARESMKELLHKMR